MHENDWRGPCRHRTSIRTTHPPTHPQQKENPKHTHLHQLPHALPPKRVPSQHQRPQLGHTPRGHHRRAQFPHPAPNLVQRQIQLPQPAQAPPAERGRQQLAAAVGQAGVDEEEGGQGWGAPVPERGEEARLVGAGDLCWLGWVLWLCVRVCVRFVGLVGSMFWKRKGTTK